MAVRVPPRRGAARARGAALLLLLSLAACPAARDRARDTATRVVIGGTTITVELARTPAEKEQGLGGRPGLAPDTGMLFVFDEPGRYSFWMLDMEFALDFVWIRSGRIVDLTTDVPPPPTGVDPASGTLRLLEPREPVDLVLEVAAGTVAKRGFKLGDAVEIEPPPR
ncbi:MAG TPA: DUF192 domain-containing protein [Myxococcota bacterium]|jgi:uncharacterized membrane protein (UPF0127 family)|nr:DUF192 domain-containing protein [Myxococcota bacterium]